VAFSQHPSMSVVSAANAASEAGGLLVGLVAYENRTMIIITPSMAADSYTT
jgi:hypothetical protein